MKKQLLIFCLCSLIIIRIPAYQQCRAAQEKSVVINEVAWMGNASSTYHEWIELYNATDYGILLDGWTLKALDGTTAICLVGEIGAYSYFLLERSDDESVPGIMADQFFSGTLANTGEILELRDDKNNLIDLLDAAEGWPAGDNGTKATLERDNEGGYQTSLNSGGTPKA